MWQNNLATTHMPYLHSLRLRSLIISNIELVIVTDTLGALVASIVKARKKQIPAQSQDNGDTAELVTGTELVTLSPKDEQLVMVTGTELAIVNSDGQLVRS